MIYHITFGTSPVGQPYRVQFGLGWKAHLHGGLTDKDWNDYLGGAGGTGIYRFPALEYPCTVHEQIKNSKNDTFVFILTKTEGMLANFDKWLELYGLKEYEIYRTPGTTNANHMQRPKNLVMVFLQSKEHFQRKGD
jgi:hypothetical protein